MINQHVLVPRLGIQDLNMPHLRQEKAGSNPARPTTFSRGDIVFVEWRKHAQITSGYSRFSLRWVFTVEVACP